MTLYFNVAFSFCFNYIFILYFHFVFTFILSLCVIWGWSGDDLGVWSGCYNFVWVWSGCGCYNFVGVWSGCLIWVFSVFNFVYVSFVVFVFQKLFDSNISIKFISINIHWIELWIFTLIVFSVAAMRHLIIFASYSCWFAFFTLYNYTSKNHSLKN